MRWLCIAVALTGCSFSHGVASQGADAAVEVDAEADATPDTPGVIESCYERWLDHSIRFGTPVPLTTLNADGFDRDPFLTFDELTAYISTARTGSMGGDVWVATRPNLASPFSAPTRATAFDSADGETKVSITKNGLIAVVGSDRTGSTGALDVWMSVRAMATDAWPALNRTKVMAVETAGNEQDPEISADGLHLYLAPDPSPQQLVVATRANVGANFSAPAKITELNSGMGDADPTVTEDERIIVFSSGRTPSPGTNGDIWYSTRADKTAMWDPPMPVADINGDDPEGDPHLSRDGCRLYFGRYVDATADWDIFMSTASNAQ